jgi:agmatine deiminase
VAFPSDLELWPDLAGAQDSFARMCRAIAHAPAPHAGERLEILVQDEQARAQAEQLLEGLAVRLHKLKFGDIWMRDIAPVFLQNPSGEVASVRFVFNGWGGKYLYPGDDEIAAEIQRRLQLPAFASSLVCEGGGLEVDGDGLCLSTREVVLNDNRNPGLSQADAEARMGDALGIERVIWLEQGLLNDHTDGHIDNIARFVGKGRVLCMHAVDRDDPNREVLKQIESDLHAFGLDVVSIPSPGLVLGREGLVLPASYCNFYIANHSVVVPVFGTKHDEAALRAIEQVFPGRTVIDVPAKVFLQEGGTVHCITQQEPQGVEA